MAPQEEREAFDAEVQFHVGASPSKHRRPNNRGHSRPNRFFTSSLLAFQKRGWEENGSQDLCTNPERPGCPQSSSWFWMFWKLMKLAID